MPGPELRWRCATGDLARSAIVGRPSTASTVRALKPPAIRSLALYPTLQSTFAETIAGSIGRGFWKDAVASPLMAPLTAASMVG